MKKSLSVLLAAFLSLAACQNIEQLVPEVADDVLSARIEQGEVTKTVLGESNNIFWSEDDQIVAFMKTSYGHKYKIQSSFVGKTYANFSKISSVSGDDLSAGMKWDHNVAYYPYAEGIECVKSDVNYTLDVVIPVEQTYAENSFGNGYFPMVAVSEDNDITFNNVCGGMKLQLKGTQKVTSITVQGKNNEVLSGTATVTAYTDGETKPSITMTGTDAASKSVTLDCGAGVQLSESTVTEFIIALPPVDFTEGFAVTVTDSHGNNQIVETDEENSVLRSSLLIMPPVKLEDSAEQSNVKFSLLIAPDTGTKAGSYSEHVDIVYYEVWDSDWSRKIYPKDDNELAKEVVVGGKATVNLSLASTNTYNIIFWAQNEECGAYDVKDLRRVKIDYSAMSASEDSEEFESFYAVKNFTVYGSVEETIHLKRPLALIYFGEQESDVESPSFTGISLTVSNLATVFNTLEGCGEVATEKQVTFVADAQNLSSNGLNGKKYTMNYVFASGSSSQVKADACFEIDGQENPLVCTLENVTIGKNKRTDILVKWRDSGLECSVTLRSNDDTFMDELYPTPSEPESTDLSEEGTANSYIVSQAGAYKFSTVKGNSSESVGAVASAEVLWESFGTDVTPNVGDLVKNASYSDGYITFQTADTFKEGNAVIAAKDASGNILWSWHIWLTDEPEGQVYYNNAGTMMDRNLGATSATPGDVGALGLLYQWGRKDPFLGGSSISSFNEEAASTITWPSAVSSASSNGGNLIVNGTIEYATAHPTTFITYNYQNVDWYYTGDSSTDNTRWTESDKVKSIYDPCPAGWRVPDGGEDGVWSTALGSSSDFTDSVLYDATNEGMNFSGRVGSDATIWYPSSGFRNNGQGSLYKVGYNGYYWSASPSASVRYYAYRLYFYSSGDVNPSSNFDRAFGYSVRCVRVIDEVAGANAEE